MNRQRVEELVSEKDAESCEEEEPHDYKPLCLLPDTVRGLQTGTFLGPRGALWVKYGENINRCSVSRITQKLVGGFL